MKKFIFMLVAMMFATIGFAQDAELKNVCGHSKFTDNWSIGLTGGVQTNLHDWNAPQGAVVGIEMTKQLTPLFGLGLEVGTGINNRGNWYSPYGHVCNGTAFDQVSVMASGRFNLMNAFCGYKGSPRLFEVVAIGGVGYGHGFATESSDVPETDALLTKTGLHFNFNLGKSKAWTISVRPEVLWNTSATGQFNCKYGVGQLTAGVVYHFKTSNKTRHAVGVLPIVKEVPVEVVSERVVEVEKTVEVVSVKSVDNCFNVDFAKGSSTITSDVSSIAEALKQTNGEIRISGFTSPEGSEKVNKSLGIARAEALKKALVDAGVDAGRIVVDNLYESLRTAIIRVK